MKNLTKSYLEDLAFEVIGAAIEVHRTIGTGLLESIYHRCMEIELEERGIALETESVSILCIKEGSSIQL